MKYDFDEIYSRKGTNTVKYDLAKQMFGTEDVLPMWVADMDLKTPDFILDAIRQRTNHEILGYTIRGDSFYQSIIQWIRQRHQWEIKKDWISFSPGVVPALSMIIRAFTKPGDKIIVQPPVYFPFFHSVTNNGRQLIYNQLKYENAAYSFDIENLKSQIDSRTKMILLCNPHNPVGKVWKKHELSELAEICLKNDILMISDEIHSDIIFNNQKHIPLASISQEISQNTITTFAPSKTFNLAGLSTSYLVISNQKYKTIYDNYLSDLHLNNGNIFGNIALESAYMKGEDWLTAMNNYIQKNTDIVRNFSKTHQDKISLVEPEATYLLWLDFRKLQMNDENLREFIIKKAKLGLNPGTQFGPGGEGFQRINVACSRVIVKQALHQLEEAFNLLGK
jgi:cystathionine beta-lyase